MIYLKKMTVKSFLLISLLGLNESSAMQRIDDPTAIEDAITLAKTIPCATGVMLSKDGCFGSVVFLNETTALTSAHAFIGREKTPHIVFPSCHFQMFKNSAGKFDWDFTFQKIKEKGISWSVVKSKSCLSKFLSDNPKAVSILDYNGQYFSDLFDQWENRPEEVFSEYGKTATFYGQIYQMTGPDISVVKLKDSITLTKKCLSLEVPNFNELMGCPAYSLGTPGEQLTSDGESMSNIRQQGNKVCIEFDETLFQAYNLKQTQDQSYFYSVMHSKGGVDEQFICTDLPSPGTDRFIGLLTAGMSGGPLIFKNLSNDYVLAGINVLVWAKNVNGTLDSLIPLFETLKEQFKTNPQVVQGINGQMRDIQEFYNKPFPIYNVFQALTPEIVAKIRKIMER